MRLQSVGAVLCLTLTACSRYADFTLPKLPGGNPALTFTFEEQPAPVLPRGSASDVLNPSVTRTGDTYTNYYSVFDGAAWRTARATSPDGLAWRSDGIILSPDPHTWQGSYIAANGALFENHYWYVAGPREHPAIGLQGEPRPVLEHGPWQSWDESAVADPYVLRAGNSLYLYYLGQDRGARQQIGLARSTDGVHWQKLRTNPVLSADENLGEPAVWQSHGFYWMLYTVRLPGETRVLRLARSTDGVDWQKLPAEFHGARDWDSKVICDPTVIVSGDAVLVWFGGGNIASPDEKLNGQIGFGVLRPVNATLEK